MSETTSSPSISMPPVSPYSLDSLDSPADSAPRSELTSDEEPDLGFNEVLRELPHLQPSHRIPIQIRSATSSTTPTYHAESVTGTDVRSRGGRSRSSDSTRPLGMGASTISSFSRPPTSSIQPDGSTVWDHPRIARYLFGLSATPSNDQSIREEEEEEEEETTDNRYRLLPISRSSTPRTVEIADERDRPAFDDVSQDLLQLREVFSPETMTTAIPVPVSVAGENQLSQRLDSQETAHTEDDIEIDSLSNRQDRGRGDSDILTSTRDDMVRPRPPLQEEPTITTPSSQEYDSSNPSMQLKSQADPPPSTTTVLSSVSSVSPAYEIDSPITIPIAGPSSINSFITTSMETTTSTSTSTSASDSTSTLMNVVRNRGRNPPSNLARPSTISETSSSYTTTTGTGSATRSSLMSYQLPEAPSVGVIYEDSEPERSPGLHAPRHANVSSNPSVGSDMSSVVGPMSGPMRTQQAQSTYSSGSASTNATVSGHRRPTLLNFDSSSVPGSSSPRMNVHSYSSFHLLETPPSLPADGSSIIDTRRNIDVVNDLGTPDQPPSESIVFDRPSRIFELVRDDDDEHEPATVQQQISDTRNTTTDRVRQQSVSTGSSSDTTTSSAPSSAHISTRTEMQNSGTTHYTASRNRIEDEADVASFQYPYSHTPRQLVGRTPRGIPLTAPSKPQPTNEQQASASTSTSASKTYSFLEQQFGALNTPSLASLGIGSGSTHNPTESQSKLDIQPSNNTISRSDTIVASSQSHVEPSVAFQQARARPLPHVPQSQIQALTYPLTPRYEFMTPNSFIPMSLSEQQVPARTHGYSHASSIGLHLLPSEPLTLDSFEHPKPDNTQPDRRLGSHGTRHENDPPHPTQPHPAPIVGSSNIADWETEQLHAEAETSQTRLFPSLGYLDEALGFIAEERAKWSAARENVGSNAPGSGSRMERSIEVEEEDKINDLGRQEAEPEPEREGREWQHAIDPDKAGGEQPKRKRRRKRSSKHSTPAILTTPQEIPVEILPPGHTDIIDGSPITDVKAIVQEGSSRRKPGSSPRKRRSKSAAPSIAYSISGHSVISEKSGTMTPGRPLNTRRDKDFLVPPPAASTFSDQKSSVPIDSDFDDGIRTPTNVGGPSGSARLTAPGISDISTPSRINFTGAKGKRVGRREREREKLKFDMMKMQSVRDVSSLDLGDEFDIGVQYEDGNDNVDDDRKEDEEEPDGLGENDSISNMSLLQPPRRHRSRRSLVGDMDHPVAIDIVYQDKEMSVSPKGKASFTGQAYTIHEVEHHGRINPTEKKVDEGEVDVFASKPSTGAEKEKEKKKRTRPKRIKPISQSQPEVDGKVADEGDQPESSKSKEFERKAMTLEDVDKYLSGGTPSSKSQNEGEAPAPNSKRGRLLSLAQNLQQLFPQQRDDLARIVKRIMKPDAFLDKKKGAGTADVDGSAESPNLVKSLPIPVPGKGKKRKGHTRATSEGTITIQPDNENNNTKHAVTDGEAEPDEEEIDPRGRVPKKKDPLIHVFIDHSNILIGLLSHLKRATPFPKRIYIARRKPLPAVVTQETTINTGPAKVDPASALAAVKPSSSRPLPVLPNSAKPLDSSGYLIPLPSFATLPRALPSTSILTFARDHGHSSEEIEHQKTVNSDGFDGSGVEDADNHDSTLQGSLNRQREKRQPKHLWHASLTLILERGRPVTRRVVVASSPLYQPMESIERLGYELRVFIRVPDVDHERNKDRAGAGKPSSVGKGSQASPAKVSHVKRISGNTSAESGSGGNASGAGSSSLHPYQNTINPGSPQKVKFREQGVDELLQLKLHQAIADSDNVPDGSTIVLATGDGNIGQFNEEGFLGPIRTALRRGWRVELYAWEDGLSRAWRREFGEATEWGKRGMFRIIGMEQFANWLVETPT